jgi:NlpC/P60 family putative phage cell wall peptidase
MTRDDIVTAARAWVGTPYLHQGAARGVGCDCLGLVRGLLAELTGAALASPPPYSPDWAEARGRDTLLQAARRHLIERAPGGAEAGDVVVFRLRRDAMAKHAAVLAGGGRMIHAYSGHAVVEVAIGPWWRRRIAAAFSFPGVQTAGTA